MIAIKTTIQQIKVTVPQQMAQQPIKVQQLLPQIKALQAQLLQQTKVQQVQVQEQQEINPPGQPLQAAMQRQVIRQVSGDGLVLQ